MKIPAIAAVVGLLATPALGFQLDVYTQDNYAGQHKSLTNTGSLSGQFHSYKWQGTRSGHCAQFCNGNRDLGYRCDDYSNNAIWFTKAIVYKYPNKPGC
ncbi:hypothetical protein, variant [Spizellomyces punctatus DAOM BR117]|nr:hypothetical protein, variant [Spizellomyces punctatus DAOM BR117]KNC96607.1 hypothetical protein, variant [Spizellomyces punctatus DAOM BR117]|eukprot:XP_016604647.1 hypothetical protein, variant [Spizellomyces punctatus DAOM BR117]